MKAIFNSAATFFLLHLMFFDSLHAPHLFPYSSAAADAPLIDIVFVHGIRGGAFATWRRDGVLARGAARENLDRSVCWPTAWLAPKFPQARLISAEYYAPASGWEGESLPLNYTAQQVAEKLAAAGVGRRPVIFVGHSMGGLVVKEIMARGYRADAPAAVRALSQACAGVVFYAVPHAGSRLADLGWGLRYIGASPAKAVAHLKTGPHQDEANAAMRKMARKAGLPVLSFSEGLPTQMSYVSAHIVPHESAYPGFGEFVVLKEHDHVSVCKPKDQDDPAFAVFAEFLNECYAAAARAAAEKREAVVDHMEAAL